MPARPAAPASPPPPAPLVDLRGVARFLSASEDTAARLVKAKIIPVLVIPSGRGDRPLLRFDLHHVREAVDNYQKRVKKD